MGIEGGIKYLYFTLDGKYKYRVIYFTPFSFYSTQSLNHASGKNESAVL